MSIRFSQFYKKLKDLLWLGLGAGILLIISCSANAVVINFDELDENSYVDENGDRTTLTNEYESQGLVFVGSAYAGGGVAGPGFGFQFVGNNLPTYVSFNFSGSGGIAAEIAVWGPGYFKSVISSGEIVGMTDDHGTPYIPNEIFSFTSPAGISSVELSGKAGAYLDNLTYTYSSLTQVPEPSTFIMLGIGLLGLIGRNFKFKSVE
jgi:hypothetical protein